MLLRWENDELDMLYIDCKIFSIKWVCNISLIKVAR